MPFQKGQAAHTEELARELANTTEGRDGKLQAQVDAGVRGSYHGLERK